MKENKSIAELLAAFNDNPKNSKVIDYITRTNYFDLIGKSRNEMVHSRMIAEILAGRYYELSRGKTLLHFFDILMKRAKEQGVEIPVEFRNAVLTRSKRLDFTIEKKEVELTLSKFLNEKPEALGIKNDEQNGSPETEDLIDTTKNKIEDKDKRLDIYLKLHLFDSIKKRDKQRGRKWVEIFIENKVLSLEGENQTQTYYEKCIRGRGNTTYQFFVYLSPLSSREIDNYDKVDDGLKPLANKDGKAVYTHICYQDILDKIIEPLLAEERLNNRDKVLLDEYVNCLELASMPDDESNKSTHPTKKELSILAISNYEKELINEFMNNSENKQLFDLVVAHLLGQKLYSFNTANKHFTFNQLMIEAISEYLKKKGVLNTIRVFGQIISRKNSGVPFIIYGKVGDNKILRYIDHRDLFEYKNIVYRSLSGALAQAIVDSNDANVIAKLKKIGRQGRGKGLLIDFDFSGYDKIQGFQLFIKKAIDTPKLRHINDCLTIGKITPVTDESFCKLLNEAESDFYFDCNCGIVNIPRTNVFFRENVDDDKQNVIFQRLQYLFPSIKEKQLSAKEIALITDFFNNNRNLVISIYRIMLEKETDPIVYEEMISNFKKIISRANNISN